MSTPKICSVDGCDRSALREDHGNRGMCSKHYARWRSHSPDRPRCTRPDCDRPVYGRGLCHAHYEAYRRAAVADGTFKPADPRDRWKRAVTYRTIHSRLTRTRGPASQHPCARCGAPANEWAYRHDDPAEVLDENGYAYSLDIEHYAPMCYRCHGTLDGRRADAVCRNGHPRSEFARYRSTTGQIWCIACSRERDRRRYERKQARAA